MVIFFILPSKILLVSYSLSSVVDSVNNQNRAEFVALSLCKDSYLVRGKDSTIDA